MLKLSITARKTAEGVEILYAGSDAGKAIDVYKQNQGDVYLYTKIKSERSKQTQIQPQRGRPRKVQED